MQIRESKKTDLHDLLDVERQAFGKEEGPVIVELVSGLFVDPTAKPLLSLIAVNNDRVIGHILFTKAHISLNKSVPAVLLAPLAVAPEAQGKGVGGKLVEEGLIMLSESEIALVFVLGHPDYYPRHGFKPAGKLGFEAPYPIPDEVADAWMVQELRPDIIGSVSGKVLCANVLNHPEYWR